MRPRLNVQPLEERIAPAFLDVVVTSASVSATSAGSNSGSNLTLPYDPAVGLGNRSVVVDSRGSVPAEGFAQAYFFDVSRHPGEPHASRPILLLDASVSQRGNSPPNRPVVLAATAEATVHVRVVPEDAAERGKRVILWTFGNSRGTSIDLAAPGKTTRQATIRFDRGTLLSTSGFGERKFSKDLAVSVGDEFTFVAEFEVGSQVENFQAGTKDHPVPFRSDGGHSLELGMELKDLLVGTVAVADDTPIHEGRDIVWNAASDASEGPIADVLPVPDDNISLLNPNGIVVRPQFGTVGFVTNDTQRVELNWTVHRIDGLGLAGDVDETPIAGPNGTGTESWDGGGAVPIQGATARIPTPSQVGRYELRLNFVARSASGAFLLTQQLRHRWYVTFARPAAPLSEDVFNLATAWGATPGVANPTERDVLTSITDSMHANPFGWRYSTIRQALLIDEHPEYEPYRPTFSTIDLLFGGGQFAECGVLSRSWVFLASANGVLGTNVRALNGRYGLGYAMKRGTTAFDGTVGNSFRRTPPSTTAARPDLWVWGQHVVGVYGNYCYDPTFGDTYPTESANDPAVSNILASFVPVEPSAAFLQTEVTPSSTMIYRPAAPNESSRPSPTHLTGYSVYIEQPASAAPPVPPPPSSTRRTTLAGSPSGEDRDGDGRFESLVARVRIDAPDGKYWLSGAVYRGDRIVSQRETDESRLPVTVAVTITGGRPSVVPIGFSGEDIRAAGGDGPFTIRLGLTDEDGTFFNAVSAGIDGVVPSRFGEAPGDIASASSRYAGDGSLVVTTRVNAYRDGDYTAVAAVYSPDGQRVAANSGTATLSDDGTITVSIPRAELLASPSDGPYRVDIQLIGPDFTPLGSTTVNAPAIVPPPPPPPPAGVVGLIVDTSRAVFRYDAGTGAVTRLGTLPFVPFDIATAADGRVFALSYEEGGSVLYRVFVGAGVTAQRVGLVGAFVNSLAFAPDGTLVGAGVDRLFRIDTTTGAATLLSQSPRYFLAAGDLAFGPDGAAYLTGDLAAGGELARIEGFTDWSFVGATGVAGLGGLGYDGGLIAFGKGGTRCRIDPSTGASTLIGSLDGVGDIVGYAAGAFAAARPTTWVGYPQFAVAADRGGAGVTLYNPDQSVRFTIDPFAGFTGGVRVASADFNGDGVADLVVGTGPGRSTRVVVLDGVTQAELFGVDPFEPSFRGGVFVAAGDLNGDGVADLVITPDQGGGPRCRVFDGATFTQSADFFGIDDTKFRGGARAAVGDLSGDGVGDLVVAAGFGGGPRVAGFDGTSLATERVKVFDDFFAFEATLRNGAFVAAGDLDGDGRAELIAGGGPGGAPRVTAFTRGTDATYAPTANFFAGDVNSRGGARVAVKDIDGDAMADLVVGAGSQSGSRVTAYLGTALAAGGEPASAFGFDAFAGFGGGVFVG